MNAAKQQQPSKSKSILAESRNVVHVYMALLCMLGQRGVLTGDVLFLSEAQLKDIAKRVNTPVSPIPLDVRLRALERAGLVAKDGGFVSEHHPGMFQAMQALAAKCEKLSGFDFFAFTCTEFRNIAAKYKPTYEDYYRPLIAPQRERALAIHDFAVKHGLNPTVNTFWKVEYKYKGAQVMCIGSEGDCQRMLDIRISCTYNWNDPALINDRLAQQSPEFQKYALRHIWRCTACATTHLGGFVTVLGKRQRVCGGSLIGFRWSNPAEEDLRMIGKFIEIRTDIIDEIKKSGKKA